MKAKTFILDDDKEVAKTLARLLRLNGIDTEVYCCGQDFLSIVKSSDRGCLILDLKMPILSGLDVQQALIDKNIKMPIIFLTGHGDVSSTRNALKHGAFDFLQKPIIPEVLFDTVKRAMDQDRENQKKMEELEQVKYKIKRLSMREKQIASYIVGGYTSKEIARLLSISPRTVDTYRESLMIKLQAKGLADLISVLISYNRLMDDLKPKHLD